MRKIISLMHMSLDGFVAGPKGEMDWIKIDDQVFDYVDKFIAKGDTALYGPKTFQMMDSHWPGVLKDPKASGHQLTHARWYEKAEKLVFSRKLEKLSGDAAKLVSEDVASTVKNLKMAPGKDIIIIGSPGLVWSFMELGLIDEFLIMLNPVILGSGIAMFKDVESVVNLQLAAATEFKVGVIGLHYNKK